MTEHWEQTKEEQQEAEHLMEIEKLVQERPRSRARNLLTGTLVGSFLAGGAGLATGLIYKTVTGAEPSNVINLTSGIAAGSGFIGAILSECIFDSMERKVVQRENPFKKKEVVHNERDKEIYTKRIEMNESMRADYMSAAKKMFGMASVFGIPAICVIANNYLAGNSISDASLGFSSVAGFFSLVGLGYAGIARGYRKDALENRHKLNA